MENLGVRRPVVGSIAWLGLRKVHEGFVDATATASHASDLANTRKLVRRRGKGVPHTKTAAMNEPRLLG